MEERIQERIFHENGQGKYVLILNLSITASCIRKRLDPAAANAQSEQKT